MKINKPITETVSDCLIQWIWYQLTTGA